MRKKAAFAAVAMATISLANITPAEGAVSFCGWSCSEKTPITQLTATDSVRPLVGDFDGDTMEDVLWYSPGTAADYMWYGKQKDVPVLAGAPVRVMLPEPENALFDQVKMSVWGTYTPLVGDFNGDGRDDIVWYSPGIASDSIWYFNANRTVVNVPVRIDGRYQAIVGNFDTTDPVPTVEQDDIFWYGGAETKSSLWSGNTNKTFTPRPYTTSPPAGARVLKGDFFQGIEEGGSNLDLFFYVPGTGADSIWHGDGSGVFTPIAKTVNGTYKPIVGNFDYGSLTDILWYAPGTALDSVWMNTGQAFTSRALTISGTFKPTVLKGYAKAGHDNILWNNPLGTDTMWATYGHGTLSYYSNTVTEMGTRSAVAGDFVRIGTPVDYNEDLIPDYDVDLLWYAPGDTAAQTEALWLSPARFNFFF